MDNWYIILDYSLEGFIKLMKEGNCYAASEAAFHLLGGKKAGWKIMRVKVEPNDKYSHWFLKHETGMILDLTARQFRGKMKPDYNKAIGCGFLTKKPSKKARELMEKIVWQETT